ncbi:hypothetical protein [Oceanobacillus sp. 1P07AA]|uniref:hypothetical protein n=1 Tax=Oceanobacillus sp. 1P07AA TaxID=3132293 RepID=UPI0039A51481
MSFLGKSTLRYINSPIFTPTIDRYIVFGYAFIGAFATPFLRDYFSLWQMLFIFVIFFIISFSLLKIIGKKWRQRKGIDIKNVKPNRKAERTLMNILVSFSVILLIITLVINLIANFFSWLWVGSQLFLVLFILIVRYMHLRRLGND